MATPGPPQSYMPGDSSVSEKEQCREERVTSRRTGAQLERKRMQDRKSQRNVRERTKQHIASLEEKLALLQSSTCVADALEENRVLRQKVERLESALHAIVDIAAKQCTVTSATREQRPSIAQFCPDHPVDDSTADTLHVAPPPVPVVPIVHGSDNGQHGDHVGGAAEAGRSNPLKPTGLEPSSVNSDDMVETMEEARHDPAQHFTPVPPTHATTLSLWTDSFFLDTSSTAEVNVDSLPMAGPSNTEGGASYTSYQLLDGQRLSQVESDSALFFNLDGPINFDSSHYSTNILRQETPEVSDLGLPTPQNSPPSNIWDVKLFRCISEHQSKLNPTSTRKPKDPELLMLLDPSDSHTSEDSLTRFLYPPISQWNYQLPEKLAIFWLNYIHLEYRVSPTADSLKELPTWLRPRPSQCQISHPIYIDTIPWPQLREKLILEHRSYPFNSFVTIFCYNLNINWPHDHSTAHVRDPSGTIRFSQAFKTHLRRLENWSLKPAFADTYPELSLSVTIK